MARQEKDFQREIGQSFSEYCRNNSMKMSERDREIRQAYAQATLKHFGQEFRNVEKGVYHKIVDTGSSQNPYDCFFIHDQEYHAVELKISKSSTRIDIINLFKNREHEIVALLRVAFQGMPAWVIINVFLGRGKSTAFAWSIEHYMRMCNDIAPRKSIKLEQINQGKYGAIRLQRLPRGIWDISPLFRRPPDYIF